MPITGKQLSTTSTVTIFTLLLILTTVNSVHSILQQESNILSMGIVQYNDFQSAIYWQYGAESGDFGSWDAIDSSSINGIAISSSEVHGGSKSIRFYMADGSKSDDDRRLGLFIHNTDGVYQTGFYWSFWIYIPSNIEDMIDPEYNWLTIGGLKWYFLNFKWSFGARWRLYYSSGYGAVRALVFIGPHINSGYEPPQQGIEYNQPSDVYWYHDITYGAWNHFQIYLKSITDSTGEWKAWVNDDLLGTIDNQPTHPNAFLNPPQDASFFSQNNVYPHPQLMYYVDKNAPGGILYADDVVIATEKVSASYTVDST